MLCLGEDAVLIELGNNLAEIFYDNLNNKVCIVRGNGAMGITAKGLDSSQADISIRLRDQGRITYIAFNSACTVVVVHRLDANFVDIVFLDAANNVVKEVKQSFKMTTASLRSIAWISSNQLVVITSQSLELFQVNEEKKCSVKALRQLNIAAEWAICNYSSQLLVVATGANHDILQPFIIRQGQFARLARFKVDFGFSNTNLKLDDKCCSVEKIYSRLYFRSLRRSRRDTATSDVLLYEFSQETNVASKLKYVLAIGRSGLFGVHVIDSVVIVHDYNLRLSLLFDVGVSPEEIHHSPLIQIVLEVSPTLTSLLPSLYPSESSGRLPATSPLYSPSWVMFTPDIVIDTSIGLFSRLKMRAGEAKKLIGCKLAAIFDMMNERLVEAELIANGNQQKSQETSARLVQILPVQPLDPSVCYVQKELQSSVFYPLGDVSGVDFTYVANAMLEYVRSLNNYGLTVEPYMLEMLVKKMVEAGELDRLHQLLNYKVIEDSKALAFLLISYEAKYPPLFQVGLDMLLRLGTAAEEVAEVLLTKGLLVEAMRLMHGWSFSERACSWLRMAEAAAQSERPLRWAAEGLICQKRKAANQQLDGGAEQFRPIEKSLRNLYGEEELAEAQEEVAYGDVTIEGYLGLNQDSHQRNPSGF